MIGSLRGVVLDRVAGAGQAGEVLVEAGGVGYRVTVAAGALGRVGALGGPVFLHVHTHVRDDAIVLYGFPTREERACFEALIGAHGVGPAVALALLSVHSPAALQRVVLSDDVDALTLVPGIGKKTAARLLVELKARLDVDIDFDGSGLAAVGGPGGGGTGGQGPAPARAEVRAALAGLGYGSDEIRSALARLPADGSAEDQLRLALREMAAAR
ncbi:MAG: Holliday junction branch migration protein RuvA [Acidimicrobiales bacterium]